MSKHDEELAKQFELLVVVQKKRWNKKVIRMSK